ncbi:hypothetical protein R1flu_002252 [Riccia fluitans]|uniref:Uncharacterized protein n=1 Tax=Riccia fluitans TaxID=41844 RepID=A0ABD1Y5K3_9MARC
MLWTRVLIGRPTRTISAFRTFSMCWLKIYRKRFPGYSTLVEGEESQGVARSIISKALNIIRELGTQNSCSASLVRE